MMKIQTGNPPAAGRYVIFVQCPESGLQDWTQPHIATWHDNRWHWGARPVLGWIGPLPVASVRSIVGETSFADDVFPAKRAVAIFPENQDLNAPVREDPLEYDL